MALGKSTLIKVLAGSVMPDGGADCATDGRPLVLGNVRAAEGRGYHAGDPHQESVVRFRIWMRRTIFLPWQGASRGGLAGMLLDRKKMLAETRALLGRLGEEIDPYVPVGELPMAQRQMVGMATGMPCRSGAAC